jgi:mRNA interferase MazF
MLQNRARQRAVRIHFCHSLLAPGNVLLKKGEGNVPKESVVNVSQVVTVEKADLVDRIGKLPAGMIDAVRTGLQLLFDRA